MGYGSADVPRRKSLGENEVGELPLGGHPKRQRSPEGKGRAGAHAAA